MSFLLENALNLTHEFLYENYNKIILTHFEEKNSPFLPQKQGAEKRNG